MNKPKKGRKFWIGNAILLVALLLLIFLDPLSELLGMGAMALWVALVIAGVYFLMSDQHEPPTFPG